MTTTNGRSLNRAERRAAARASGARRPTPADLSPHDLDAERAVLGAVLLGGEPTLRRILEAGVTASAFYHDAHKRVFAAMTTLGAGVDALTLRVELQRTGHLDAVGGAAGIDALAGVVPAVGNLDQYAAIVLERSLERKRRTMALRLVEDPRDERALNDLRELANPRGVSSGRLTVLSTAGMLTTEPPPVEWVVDGIVARGTLTMLSGREKEGKSLLCLALATAVASSGGTVAGIACHPGRALVIDAENGPAAIHRRVRALGLALDDADRLAVAEARGFDLRRDLLALDRLIEQLQPDLVVLDSWRSMWGGQENDSDEVAACLDPLRELGRARSAGIILIHHMSRAGAYRGSTAAGASVENILDFSRLDDDPDRRRRRLRNTGCRYEEEAPARWLTVEADRALGVILVDTTEPFGPPEDDETLPSVKPRPRDALIPDVEAQLTDEPKRLKTICEALDRDSKDRSVRRVLGGLLETNRARQTDQGWCRPTGWQGGSSGSPLSAPPPCHPATSAEYLEEGEAVALVAEAFDATEEEA